MSVQENGIARRRCRQTKIVATLGPASASPAVIRALVQAGADVFRLNFSHGTQEEHGARLAVIRALEQELGHPIGVMADMQGPKLRLGTFVGGEIQVALGAAFRLDLDPTPGNEQRCYLPHPEILAALHTGARLLLDDGKVRLRVTDCSPDHADTVVEAGTRLADHKGVNVPDVVLPLSPLTPKDRLDLAYALDQGVDWVALSFVQRPEDVAEARRLIGNRAALLVKLEKPQALNHLEELVDIADGVMVARGDLGVEMPAEQVPILQKRILRVARRAGKPVIVATQMLESMITAPTPTRAEASDVAVAVYDGADAVMLSAETAAGAYPLEAVTFMNRITEQVEHDPGYRTLMDAQHPDPDHTPSDAITAAAAQTASTIGAAAIVTYTTSGSTALRAARERPGMPLLCLTPSVTIARRLTMAFGIQPVVVPSVHSFNEAVEHAVRVTRKAGYATTGQRLVITAGVPFNTMGNTNTLRIAWVD